MYPHPIFLMWGESNMCPIQLLSKIYDILNLSYIPFHLYFPKLKCCCQLTLWMKTVPPVLSPFSSWTLHIIGGHLEVFQKKEGVIDTLKMYSSTPAKKGPSFLHLDTPNLWKPNICHQMQKWQWCSCCGGTVLIWRFSPHDCTLLLPLLFSMTTTDLWHSNILSLGTSIFFSYQQLGIRPTYALTDASNSCDF